MGGGGPHNLKRNDASAAPCRADARPHHERSPCRTDRCKLTAACHGGPAPPSRQSARRPSTPPVSPNARPSGYLGAPDGRLRESGHRDSCRRIRRGSSDGDGSVLDVVDQDRVAGWAADAFGPRATVESIRPLRPDGSPWLLEILHGGDREKVVLKAGGAGMRAELAAEAAALQLAEAHGLPTPRLVASDLDVGVAGCIALLMTYLEGSDQIPEPRASSRGGRRSRRVPCNPYDADEGLASPSSTDAMDRLRRRAPTRAIAIDAVA